MEVSAMTRKSKLFTILNLVFSSILWLLGILTLLFNILGLWVPWHLAGFGFFLFFPVPLIFSILSLLFSYKEKKLLLNNLIFIGVSVFFVLFTYFVSASWFWQPLEIKKNNTGIQTVKFLFIFQKQGYAKCNNLTITSII